MILEQPTNRSQRRQLEREQARIHDYIAWIEVAFLNQLFDSPYGYHELYEHYLCEWIEHATEFNCRTKKGVLIDADYFHDKYKPLENLNKRFK